MSINQPTQQQQDTYDEFSNSLTKYTNNTIQRTNLSNNQSFSNNYKGFNHMLGRMFIPTSKNTQFYVQKSQKLMTSDEYIRLKTYRSLYPVYPVVQTSTIGWNSVLAQQIAADGELPSNGFGCWKFINNNPNKINWYFYGNTTLNPTIKVSDIECFYLKVTLNNSTLRQRQYNKPWLTVYSYPSNNIIENIAWYRSRWNYTGLYDNGSLYELNSGTYIFYIGDLRKMVSLYNELNNFTSFRLSEYTTNDASAVDPKKILRTNATPFTYAFNEQLFLISINTDSTAQSNDFNFCLKEVGYKLKNQSQVKIITN